MLKGHEGPITKIKYNREGDLLFSCARKDKNPCAWYTDNGERLGNYKGHEGAVWDVDVDFTTTKLLTASADRTCKLWDVQHGTELFSFPHASTVRSCGFAEGSRMILTVQENNFGAPAAIFIYNIADDIEERKETISFTPHLLNHSQIFCFPPPHVFACYHQHVSQTGTHEV